MNWDDYRFFLAVARTGRLSAAGNQLGVDHATVLRRIRALEGQLNAKLFDRSPRGYTLTPSGLTLVPIAERMESGTILAEGSVGGQQDKISGRVRIGVPDGVGAYIVVEAAQQLCERYPKLEIELVAMPRQFSLSKREADFVIAVSRPKRGRLKVRKIADYKLHIYGAKSYLANHRPIKTIEDLKQLRGIGYVRDLIFDKALDYIPLVDPSLKLNLTSTSVHVQLQAVLNGAGIAVTHDFIADRYPELVPVLADKVSFKRTFWFIVHEDYAQLDRIRLCSTAIIDHMKKVLQA